jgi:hypothetical protein
MRRLFEAVFCFAGLGGLGLGLHALIVDAPSQFGHGVFVGMAIMFFLIWGTWRIRPEIFRVD